MWVEVLAFLHLCRYEWFRRLLCSALGVTVIFFVVYYRSELVVHCVQRLLQAWVGVVEIVCLEIIDYLNLLGLEFTVREFTIRI